MPRLQFIEALNCKHQDANHPMENLFSNGGTNRKWLSDPGSFDFSLVGTLKLACPSVINEIKIGNAGSSSVAVLVSNDLSPKKWSVLLMEHKLRTEADCRKKVNVSSVITISEGDLKGDTASAPWTYVQLLCYNQFRSGASEQFGLSFIYFNGEPRKSQPIPIPSPRGLADCNGSPLMKKSPLSNGLFSRSDKMMIATKAKSSPTSPVESKTSTVEDDIFDTCVISFLESVSSSNLTSHQLFVRYEEANGCSCTARERARFFRLVRDYSSNSRSKPSGILTARDSNRPLYPLSPSLNKTMKEATLNVLKPHLNDNVNAFGRDKNPVVFRTEMSLAKPMKETSVAFPMKDKAAYLDQSAKENQHPCIRPAKGATPDATEPATKSAKEGRKIWTGGRSEEDDEEEEASPNQSFKRKSDMVERGLSKKRLRDARTNGWSSRRASPLGNGRALSPPPRPDSPPVVDDIDKPSTSSTETIAERNIRLEIERRLAQRTPQDRVMRAPSGKVRGPYCTKGVTVRTSPSEANSPLRRLSISEDADEESRQARRKLHFPKSNGVASMVECPFCSSLCDSADIEQHASECSPSPRKQQPPEDDEDSDMMACPICMTFVNKDTVAAHADQCALKRYGA